MIVERNFNKENMMMTTNSIRIAHDRNSCYKAAMIKNQVNRAVTTVEQWTHTERCRLIERLLPLCSPLQLDMLWTVLQASLHRDYFYAVKSRYPDYHFKRISTPNSRALKKKESYHRYFDREESFHISNINDLQEFRDDDGLRRKSQSVFTQNPEDQLSSLVYWPPIKQSVAAKKNGKNRSAYQSVDTKIKRAKEQSISSRFTPKTARSTAVRWIDQSVEPLLTASNTVNSGQLLNWFAHSWLESEQNDFLHRLIMKFDERQQYFISCVIMQRHYRDFISLLPVKIAFQILNYLTLPQLSRTRLVSKNWKSIIDRERDLWKPKTKSKPDENRSIQTDWEKTRKQRLAIKRNWLTGTAQIIECADHTERVLCICGNITHLATGSLDRTINIWLIIDGTLCKTLIGHMKGVWSLKFLSSALLISGAYDATIKIWNINTGICLRTLLSHKGPVWSLACSDIFCLSGSQDRTARLWLLPKCELYATLTGHTSSVFGVDLNHEQNLCATASADKTVRLWSLSTNKCVKILHASTDDYIISVSLRHGFIAYAFGVHIITYRVNITEIRTCTVQKIMETQEHRGRIESVQLILLSDEEKQPSLVSAGQDGLVKFWNLNIVASQHTYNAQNDDIIKINCVYADPTHIVTAGDDRLVKILDFAPQIHKH